MKKLLIICAIVSLSGCASLGDIEGLGKPGEVIRTYNKTMNVLGAKPPSGRSGAGRLNRFVGHSKALSEKVTKRNPQAKDIPYIIRDIQDLTRYYGH